MTSINSKESLDAWGADLGGLLGNMLSFEFVLRTFLGNEEFIQDPEHHQGGNYDTLKVGDIIPENAFTNYDSLGQLISKFNSNAKVIAAGYSVDPSLVDIRDAFAHGRVAQFAPNENSCLLKFSRPNDGHKVVVTHCVQLSHEYLDSCSKAFYSAIDKAVKAHRLLQYV